jgi:hypothetical protein
MKATDPRDKIYSLLGLYSSLLSERRMGKSHLKPNYHKTDVEIFGDIIHHSITLPKDRDSLESSLELMVKNENLIDRDGREIKAKDTEDENDFPSWIPRWDQRLRIFKGMGKFAPGRTWSPSGDSEIVVGENEAPKILSLQGFEVSIITFLKQEFQICRHLRLADR